MHNRQKLCDKLSSGFLRKWWFVILLALVLLLFGAVIAICFMTWVNLIIDKEIVLRNGSPTFDWWRLPPVSPVMRIYVYNVTNAEAFLTEGQKPILEELGPYVYVLQDRSSNTVMIQTPEHPNGSGLYFGIDHPSSAARAAPGFQTFLVPNHHGDGSAIRTCSNTRKEMDFISEAVSVNMRPLHRQKWEKVNLDFNDNGTVTFNQRKVFTFDPEMSAGDEDDMVVVPNIPMLSATSQSKHAARFLRLAMASIMDILKIKPFVEVTVGQLMWGYEDPLLKLAKDVVPKEQKLPYEEFGLMYGKNGTSPDNVTVFTGASDITRFGLVDTFNGKHQLEHWKTDQCNSLLASDGSIFPPHITTNSTLYVYDKDLCRRLPLRFQKEVETNGGVLGYRFTPPTDVFADIARNPENDCFCPAGPPCAPHGLQNVSLCQYDSPILLSFPHFYLADPKLREAVEGISPPDPEKHQLFIDIQPQMGVALGARARVQINLAVSQVIDIKQVASFPDIVFPIMWFEDGIDGLPEEVTDLLSLATKAPPLAQAVISYALFALGAVLLILAVTCLVRSSGRQETLNLEGTSHYTKPEKKPSPANNGHATNGKTTEMLNPAFVGGPENGVTGN